MHHWIFKTKYSFCPMPSSIYIDWHAVVNVLQIMYWLFFNVTVLMQCYCQWILVQHWIIALKVRGMFISCTPGTDAAHLSKTTSLLLVTAGFSLMDFVPFLLLLHSAGKSLINHRLVCMVRSHFFSDLRSVPHHMQFNNEKFCQLLTINA